jgi:outer membrane cobalamin receptor
MSTLRTNLVLLFLFLFALPLCAQTTDMPDEEAAEPDEEVTVVVTAERRLQPISESIATTTVITAKEIKATGAQTVADVLRLGPGATIRQSGTPGALVTTTIRGSSSNQVLVLVDGQRISSPAFFGGTDLSKFPVHNIARIEIIRGPASSLYGSEAFGGVINIITRTPGAGFSANLGGGNHGRDERSLTVDGPIGAANWQLTASAPSYDGFRPNSKFSATSLAGKVMVPDLAGWSLTLSGEDYHDKLGLPGPSYAPDPDDTQWWDRERAELTLKRALGFGEVEIHASQNQQGLNNSWSVDDPYFPSFGTSLITGTTRAMEMVVRGDSWDRHAWAAGVEYRDDTYHDMETGTYADPSLYPQRESVRNRALFVQDRWSVTGATDLVIGARLDDHSTAGGKTTPRAGIVQRLSSNLHLRASYAEGFRAPNFVELYYPAGPWGPGYSGNPNLKPETSRQYEVGINRHLKNDDIDLAFFTTDVSNLIKATSATPYENVGRARQRGAELNWRHRFTGNTSLNFAYTYTQAINRTTGERLLAQPYNKAALTASTRMNTWEIGLTGRWVDDRNDLFFDPATYTSTTVKLPDYLVFDLILTRMTTSPVLPYITIRNLLDRDYEEVYGFPTEGFTIESGVRVAW